MEFRSNRQNDAWATIRGFVYQVNLSIQRWLELGEDEAIELERGEDLDLIRLNVEDSIRRLEQVKVRQKRLTLRSTSACSALCNFYEHILNNRELRLKFRYVTNAKIARERKLSVSCSQPLISAWKSIYSKELNTDELADYILAIRTLLADLKRPENIEPKAWSQYQLFITESNSGELEEFIQKVEWATDQGEPDEISGLLTKTLTVKFKLSEVEAQNAYKGLFYNVFEALTHPGLKQLKQSQLSAAVNESLQLHPAAGALLSQLHPLQLKIHDVEVEQERMRHDLGLIKVRVESRDFLPDISATSLTTACNSATRANADRIIDGQQVIPRNGLVERTQIFLSQNIRYGIVIGDSGSGKSTALASLAQTWVKLGSTVLFTPVANSGDSALPEIIAEQVKPYLSPEPNQLTLSQVVRPWITAEGPTETQLIIILDGIEGIEPALFLDGLRRLHSLLGNSPPSCVKIIISCRSFDFEHHLKNDIDSLLRDSSKWRESTSGYAVSVIGDFGPAELDEALQLIGAEMLLSARDELDQLDYHVLSLRELLKHPGTFEHFSNLFVAGKIQSIQEETWSTLIGRRIESVLNDVGRRSGLGTELIRQELITFASRCREKKRREFMLERRDVEAVFPQWFQPLTSNKGTTFDLLESSGLLFEKTILSKARSISFRITDAGSYLLSFAIEEEIGTSKLGDQKTLLEAYLNEAWHFPPMMDALLAYIDRRATKSLDESTRALLTVMIESHRSHELFRLMHPAVLGSIFDLLRNNRPAYPYDYFEAARLCRFSVKNVPLIARNLTSANQALLQLAVELVGIYDLVELSQKLIKVLDDEPSEANREVRHEVYGSLGRLGTAVLPHLLATLDAEPTSPQLRRACVTALQAIGHLDEEVSRALSKCYNRSLNDGEIKRALTLTAAHLRDRTQLEHVLPLVAHSDPKIAHPAVKYFTECPNRKAEKELWKVFDKLNVSLDEREAYRSLLRSQTIAALYRLDPVKIEAALCSLIKDSLVGKGFLRPFEVQDLVKKYTHVCGYEKLFKHLIEICKSQEPRSAQGLAEILGSTQSPDVLKKLIETSDNLLLKGVDAARILVDAVSKRNREHDEYPMAEGINRVSDLDVLVKARHPHFIGESSRLIRDAPVSSTRRLCLYYWVIGDSRVESDLLDKYESVADHETAFSEQYAILRALGTCGTAKTAQLILSQLKTAKDFALHFSDEVLLSLLKRKIIEAEQLVKVCRDRSHSAVGRAVSIWALAKYQADAFASLFIELADDPDEVVQKYATLALGHTLKEPASVKLREILIRNSSCDVKGNAARSLAALGVREALSDIEDAYMDCSREAEPYFLLALHQFRSETTVPILLERLRSAPLFDRGEYLKAIGRFTTVPDALRIILGELEMGLNRPDDFRNEQANIVEGLTFEWNEQIFRTINEYIKNGVLSTNARDIIATNLSRILRTSTSPSPLLLEIIASLLCDHRVRIRDRALHCHTLLESSDCEHIYNLVNSASRTNEWSRACAVEALGFWNSDSSELTSREYDSDLLVRRAASRARSHKAALEQANHHVGAFTKAKGIERLSTYLCLADSGQLSAIWKLWKFTRKGYPNTIYLNKLSEEMEKARKKTLEEDQKRQNKQVESRGTIYFD